MAVDFHERESFLPSELLTDDVSLSKNRTFTLNGSGNVSVSNGFGSTGSSWSGLSSPFGSELGSTETESEEEDEDDDDFIAELTRQMADYMLQEDDEKPTKDCGSENLKVSSGFPGSPQRSLTPFSQHDHQAFCDDQQDQAIQLYNVENQPSVENQGQVCRRGKVKKTESTQQEEQKKLHQVHSRGTGVFGSPAKSWQQVNPGSDMRAFFLGRAGARTGSSGTGVFLPRGSGNPPAVQKKLGAVF